MGIGLTVVVVWATAFTIQKQVFQAMTVSGFLFARYLFFLFAQRCCCWPAMAWIGLS